MSRNSKDGFIVQAGILAMSGIIVRIIGILYRSPLTAIIGEEGNGYYSTAYNIYTIILLLSSYSIPTAISRVISVRLAHKEYNNVQRIVKCAFLYIIVVGSVGSILAYLLGPIFVGDNAGIVLKVFAPTIFLSGILGVMRGYFQAHKNMAPTSVSQILEQIVNASVSLGAAYFLISAVQDDSDTIVAINGAIGSAIGTGSGVVIGLLFMVLVYMYNSKGIKRRIASENVEHILGYAEIFKMILMMVTPIIMSTFLYNINISLNQTIYLKLSEYRWAYNEAEVAVKYGLFGGKATVIANIPIAIASAMSAAVIPSIAESVARGDNDRTRTSIRRAIKSTMIIGIPASVGIFALAEPIVLVLFPQYSTVSFVVLILRILAISIVFFSASTVTNGALQAAGKPQLPVINVSIALVVQTVLMVIMLMYTELGILTLPIVTIVYSALMMILNNISLKRVLKYKQEWIVSFMLPTFSSIWMGILAFGTYEMGRYLYALCTEVKPNDYSYIANVVCLAPAIIVGMIVYFILIIRLRVVDEDEIRRLPKGYMLLKIMKK